MITVDANAPAEFRDPIASLAVGEKVSLIFNVLGDERWYNVKTGMGSVGGDFSPTAKSIQTSLQAQRRASQ